MRDTETIFVTLLLLSSLAFGAGLSGAAAAPAATNPMAAEACSTTVLHDTFRFDNETIATIQNGSTAESIRDNTRVTLRKTDGFYKLHAENPNNYCVAYTVMVSSKAMTAATFPGGVQSNDGNHTANWSSTYDFGTERRYTEITFTLSPSSSTTFAPNRGAVASMSLATRSTDRAESAFDTLSGLLTGENESVEIKHTYYVEASNNTRQVRVKLTHPQTGEPIEDYNSVYTMDGNETWSTVDSTTDAPVYKRLSDDGNHLVFHFSERAQNADATVRFTANPGVSEQVRDGWDTWWSGWDGFFSDDDDDNGGK